MDGRSDMNRQDAAIFAKTEAPRLHGFSASMATIPAKEAVMPGAGDAQTDTSREPMSGMIGRSFALRQIAHDVQTVAPTDATVLIHGETGSRRASERKP